MTDITELGDEELIDSVADVLLVLSNVGLGDYTSRVPVDGIDESHPLYSLYCGINEMIASLADEQARREAYQSELEDKLQTIERQRVAIRELSTPIIEVWDSVLCLPIVGVLDTVRSTEMTVALLQAVVEKEARYAIVDITGIEVMDTGTAEHFVRMARSVSLLGAQCSLTGMNPHIAQTVAHMGIELSGIQTYRSLKDALQQTVAQAMAIRPSNGNGKGHHVAERPSPPSARTS